VLNLVAAPRAEGCRQSHPHDIAGARQATRLVGSSQVVGARPGSDTTSTPGEPGL
jgi:hypothetical protein